MYLRCVGELAEGWPNSTASDSAWAAVWETVQGHMHVAGAACAEEALFIIARSARRSLVRSPMLPAEFWQHKAFDAAQPASQCGPDHKDSGFLGL